MAGNNEKEKARLRLNTQAAERFIKAGLVRLQLLSFCANSSWFLGRDWSGSERAGWGRGGRNYSWGHRPWAKKTIARKEEAKEMKTVPCCLLKTTAREMLKTIPISLSELEQAGSYCSISGSSTYVHCAAQYWAARERDEASSSPAMPKSNDNASDSTPGTHGRAVAAIAA